MPDERKWFEIPHSDRSPEQVRQAQECYYQALLASPHGRQMVCDFRRRVRDSLKDGIKTPELAVAQLWLQLFLDETLELAGVTDDAELVDYMVPIARSWTPPEEEKKRDTGYAE
ncbi:MAG: hypothetical protein V3W44_04340 [Dehalococcoidales bacterium]